MADATPSAPIVFKKRAGRANLKKRAATPPSASSSDYSSAEDESGTRIKRRRKNGITSTSSTTNNPSRTLDTAKSTQFAGDRSAAITDLDDATKTSNWFHADEAAKTGQANQEVADKDGNYKGAKGYGNFIQKNPDKLGKSMGPVKAPTNMRMITLVDFAPDVCKDYKQTGFCGFGDSCKFLHAREDYKQGWQLDKEWEKAGKSKVKSTTVASANRNNPQDPSSSDDEEAKELEKIPFACIICKQPYKSPVVTKCNHYFCEACALKRHKSKGGKQCANCGADTGGTFNVAKNLRKLLDKKRERIRQRKEKARENGEEVSSDDEEK
ncbi:hypothetical protein E4T49_01141 [Aureobasidium sp. EXF-10728]|nr:hypothetical protein E4T49_01141 [Aureobasidium sp. EXF-10728]